jgi:hypothetical protein
MKTSTIITAAGRAAVAATPTVASCPDGQYVPVSRSLSTSTEHSHDRDTDVRGARGRR